MGLVKARTRRAPIEPARRPMVVAHRGASSAVAEHTLAAYTNAISSGADALECDVRLTRDGHLVCVHDRTIDRTSDGSGKVSNWDLDALSALDFASWHGEPDTSYLEGVAPDRVDATGGVLTLQTLLALVYDAPRSVRLLVETKHPTRYGGLVESELVRALERFGWAGKPNPSPSLRHPANGDNQVIVMSFAQTALRRVKLQAPDVPTVLLQDRLLPGRRDGGLPTGVPITGPGLQVLRADPGYVQRAHARGNPVFVWTVDEPSDVAFVRGLSVEGIITNRPEDVIEALDVPSAGTHDC